jgi:hypothetical protein
VEEGKSSTRALPQADMGPDATSNSGKGREGCWRLTLIRNNHKASAIPGSNTLTNLRRMWAQRSRVSRSIINRTNDRSSSEAEHSSSDIPYNHHS